MTTETKPFTATERIHENLATIAQTLVDCNALFDELRPTNKQLFVDSLKINELTGKLHDVNGRIIGTMQNLTQVKVHQQSLRKQIDEARSLKLLDPAIDGKNAEIRAAQLTQLLRDDLEYIALTERINMFEQQHSNLEVELEGLRNAQSALKIEARLIAAQLEYLAS